MTVRIESVGAISSNGIGVRQVSASLRAGLARCRRSSRLGPGREVTVAFVPDDTLAAATPSLAADEASLRSRLLALASVALRDAMAHRSREARPLVVMLGLPDPRESVEAIDTDDWWRALAAASGWAIDEKTSRLFPRGRASIFEAIAAGRELLAAHPRTLVVCGAVDSYASPHRIEHERALERTVGADGPGDGRVLGEGCGMLLLRPSIPALESTIEIVELGTAEDLGHRFAQAPARGEGLADAIEALRTRAEPRPFRTVWAGLTGESHDVKSWCTASLRHRDVLLADGRIEHPADRFGDAGAALGALLFADAHECLRTGRRSGPALVWAASDRGLCGCADVRVTQRKRA